MNFKQLFIIPAILISTLGFKPSFQEKGDNQSATFKGNTNVEFPKYVFSKIDKVKYKKSRPFFLELTTNEKGKIVSCNLKNGENEEAKEVIDIVKKMPKWSPAKKDGKNIVSTFVVPLSFD